MSQLPIVPELAIFLCSFKKLRTLKELHQKMEKYFYIVYLCDSWLHQEINLYLR